jgi:DNA primase
VEEIQNDDLEFQHPVYRKVIEIIVDLVNRKMKIDSNFFIMHEDIEVSSVAVDMMTEGFEDKISKIWSKNNVKFESEEMKLKEIVPELVISFKNKKMLEMIRETQDEIIQAQAANDMESITLLLQKMQILNELKRSIAKKLGDRIIL